jgi:hypothetical protein
MNTTLIPVSCPHCGALFASRAFHINGNVQRLMLSGNRETCPYCGNMAHVADGVFNVAKNVLSVVSAPNITKQMLTAFEAAVRKAYTEKTAPELLASEVEKIDPTFGDAFRKAGNNNQLYAASLLIALVAIKSCTLDVKLDANRLIEQLTNSPPAIVISPNISKK